MKNFFLALFMFCSIFTLTAQEQDSRDDLNIKKNELKANGLFLVIGALDFSYERLINEESGFGLNVVVPYDEDIKESLEYFISPYYRFYFGDKYAAGFFLEGFGMLNSTERDFDFFIEEDEREYVTDFALGIGLGGKWITKSGFIGEINFGVGRNIFKSEETDIDFVSKSAITAGYRF